MDVRIHYDSGYTPAMARISKPVTLKHQANLGGAVEEFSFEAGDEVTVMKQWEKSALCKTASGQLFNIPAEYLAGPGPG